MAKEKVAVARINVPVSRSMKAAVIDYWHENRIKSQAAAIRRLIEIGLQKQRDADHLK